ncbi:HlyD family type I secretion periplasmic adaptor subunit [Pseudomonas sp.]|uniref:HlyD family type I secretion periplasmic adaptor subunit n=1 Tax=Pseudomonas sp. TaxID=306 RepID=UPI003CC6B788
MSPIANERTVARLGWTLLLLGLGGFFAWAMWAPLDQGVAVAGHLTVVGQRQTVQHASGGVVESILVSDGQPVEAGQPLMRLQQPILQSQVRNLRHQWQAAEAQMARLSAEQNGETPQFPAHLDPAVRALHQQLFERRASSLLSERQALKASLLGSQAQLKGLKAALSGQRQQQRSLQAQTDSLQTLASEGFVSQHRALEFSRQLTQLGVAIDESHGRIGLLRRQVEEQQVRYGQLEETFRRDATSQLADTRQQAEDLRHRLAVAERELAASTLLAPVTGRVSGLQVSTLGEVVKPGQVLLDIVPRGKPLQVEARLPVESVDKVRIGLPVELLFPAFNQSTTPRVSGRVTLVGADRQQDERTGEPYYLLRAEVSGQAQLAGLTLQPGMPVQAFIRTGERSLLNYLLKPLRDRSRLALVEE